MNPTLDQLEQNKSHLATLLREAQIARAIHTPAVSLRRRIARFLKRVAAQLEPELQTARV
jgi:hypothetical protein